MSDHSKSVYYEDVLDFGWFLVQIVHLLLFFSFIIIIVNFEY